MMNYYFQQMYEIVFLDGNGMEWGGDGRIFFTFSLETF